MYMFYKMYSMIRKSFGYYDIVVFCLHTFTETFERNVKETPKLLIIFNCMPYISLGSWPFCFKLISLIV